jgi:hypothetical protein
VKFKFWLLTVLAFCGVQSAAQTHWCPANRKADAVKLFYPPIARVAFIWGLVIGRLKFSPDGNFPTFEPVSGPVMLSNAVGEQAKSWKSEPTTVEQEPCQLLVVAKFTIGDLEAPNSQPIGQPGIISIEINAERLVLSDPEGTITRSRWAWLKRHRKLDQ